MSRIKLLSFTIILARLSSGDIYIERDGVRRGHKASQNHYTSFRDVKILTTRTFANRYLTVFQRNYAKYFPSYFNAVHLFLRGSSNFKRPRGGA